MSHFTADWRIDRSDWEAAPQRWSMAGRITGGVVIAVLFMGSTLLTPLYEIYKSSYGFSPFVLVLLYSVYVIGNLLALFFFGQLSDRIGRKPLVFAALTLAAISAAVFLVAENLGWLFLARVISGLAVGIGSGSATAWITEFMPPERRASAAAVMTGFNFLGLAIGPLVAGLLVQYAPHPLRLPFLAYIGTIAVAVALAAAQPETLVDTRKATFKPRLGVPPDVRSAFIAPAAGGFAAMAVVGFYAALGPTVIRQNLHRGNHALASAVVAELFILSAALIVATRKVDGRKLMLFGLAATPIGMALLILAERSGSLAVLLVGTAVCSITGAFGYRGGLAVVNSLAPQERRAEIASAFFVCCFCGNALPIIGVGALMLVTSARTADLIFAIVIAGIAALAFAAAFAVPKRAEMRA